MRTRFLLGFISVVLITMVVSFPAGLSTPARAQDGGLSEEELALLDRIFATRENFLALTSYEEQISAAQRREIKLVLARGEQTSVNLSTWARKSDITIVGEFKNAVSHVSATLESQATNVGGQQDSQTFSIEADVRRVDGKLYVNAQYDTPQVGADWPELPSGWVEVIDFEQWPLFDEMELDDYLDEESSPFDDPEMVKAMNPDVSSAPGALDDGTPVDVITVIFDVEAVKLLYKADPLAEPVMAALLANLSAETYAHVTLFIDADNMLRRMETDQLLKTVGVDAGVLGQGRVPAGTTFDLSMGVSSVTTYDMFNATFDPVTVPDVIAR